MKENLSKRRIKERRVFEEGIGEEKKQVKINLKTHFPAKHERGGGAERIDGYFLLTNHLAIILNNFLTQFKNYEWYLFIAPFPCFVYQRGKVISYKQSAMSVVDCNKISEYGRGQLKTPSATIFRF